MGLAELEVLEVVMLDEGLAGDIETREQPAPPRALLVGHWLALSLHFVVENMNIGLQTSDNVISIIIPFKMYFIFQVLTSWRDKPRAGQILCTHSERVCLCCWNRSFPCKKQEVPG